MPPVASSVKAPPANATAVKRRAAEVQGRTAEAFVAEHWRAKGFDVLASRLRTPAGEIDLIVADRATLVFIEVKSRKNLSQAAYALQPRQQSRLFHAADAALADRGDWARPNIRFDIALVCGGAVEHIQDALRHY